MTTEPMTLTPGGRRVLDAASALFYADGIHAVGVDAIAREAGVTKKTIYDRFGSKDALAVAYLRARDDAWREHLDATLAGLPPGVDRLLAVFDIAGAWAAERSPRGCSAINARAETGDDAHPIAVEVAREKAWLRERFAGLARESGAAPAEAESIANTCMLLYEGALVTVGMRTFDEPFAAARRAAAALCARLTG